MKSSVKLMASVVVLAIFTGMLVTDADAGRRCRKARRCYTPCYYYTNCCQTSCCNTNCCHTNCCKTNCCEQKACCEKKEACPVKDDEVK